MFLEIESEIPFEIPSDICKMGKYTPYRVETIDGSSLEGGSILEIRKDGVQSSILRLPFKQSQFQLFISEFPNPKSVIIDTVSKFELVYTAPSKTKNIGIRVYHQIESYNL